MQASDIRHQFPLHRWQIATVLLFVSAAAGAQSFVRKNNPEYDKRFLTYGFAIGIHSSAYQVRYSDAMVTNPFDTLHSVMAEFTPGFSLGFLMNLRMHENVHVRLMPRVSFYDHTLRYSYTDGREDRQRVETAMVEFPLLMKYNSTRRGNVRMYMIGGFTPGFEISGKNDASVGSATLPIRKRNFSIDAGIGFDFYFPLFKFSQEIRFSRGLSNMLGDDDSVYREPLRQLNTHTIGVYFIFQ